MDPVQRGVSDLIRSVFEDMTEKQRTDYVLELAVRDYVQHQRERNAMAGPHRCPACGRLLVVDRGGGVRVATGSRGRSA